MTGKIGRPRGVGIVGLSARDGWAQRTHVPALQAVDGVRLTGLSTASSRTAALASERFGVPGVACARELAAREDVDLLVVSVKVPYHFEVVCQLLDANKPILCEWPLAVGTAKATELAARAEAAGIRTFVGLQARAAPALRYVRDLITDGYVGEVLSTHLIGSGDAWGPTCNDRTVYNRTRSNGSTLLTIPFAHAVEGLTYVLGEFRSVSATTASRRSVVTNTDTGERVRSTSEDQVAVTGILEGGAVASMHLRGEKSPGVNLLWQIDGTDGNIQIIGYSAQLQFGQVAARGSRGGASLESLPIPPTYGNVPALAGRSAGRITTMAHAYSAIRDDLMQGTFTAPDFAHAVRRHRFLDDVAATAESPPP